MAPGRIVEEGEELLPNQSRALHLACLGCLIVALTATAPASADPPDPPLPACADTVTPDQLSVGQDGAGYTVRQGTTVESFDVKILGVMHDGIAPGRDLIIVDTSGTPIDEAGGIWFGMSGSPVYTLDGKLIGAIAYGFSSTSSIAGIAPANPDMLRVFNEADSSDFGSFALRSPAPRTVRLSHRIRARVARREHTEISSVSEDVSQLKVPVSVSGLTAAHRAMLRRGAIDHDLPFFIPSIAGSSSSADATQFGTVAPGDSFAAVLSYGDITFAGIGTTTYVCDGKALAFGHPFFLTGPTTLGANAASAFGIVDDPVFGPFKLADATDPLGVVDRDRLTAIRAQLGQEVPTVPVTQDTTALDTGNTRLGGETDVVQGTHPGEETSLPFLAWIHSFSNIDSVFDQVSGGSSHISWTIRGVRTDSGEPWELTRSNRWISKHDISFESTFELLSTLAILQEQTLAPVEFTDVDIGVEVEQTVHELTIRKVLWSKNGIRYRDTRHLRAHPGQRIYGRVRMRDSDGGRKTAAMKFHVPRRGGRVGLITVAGGGSGGGVNPFCVIEGGCGGSGGAKSFSSLLAKLHRRLRNDDVVGQLRMGRGSSRVVRRQPKVVRGHDELRLIIGGGGHHHHHAAPRPRATRPA
jgi:hypothetical protein